MDTRAVLSLFDEQCRRNPKPGPAGERIEREPHLTRVLREEDGLALVCWSDLRGLDLDEVIAGEIGRFADSPVELEWKHYSYDLPAELPERLRAAGFEEGELETVLVADIAELALEESLPAGVEVELVRDAEGVSSLLAMLDGVFGSAVPGMARAILAGMGADPPRTAALAALADGRPIAGGRIEFEAGSQFAGLWGGATVPEWRSQGIFRALVAHATSLAARRGYRFVQVDAAPTSRPILERLGFVELAKTTPFTYPPAPEPPLTVSAPGSGS